MIYLDGCIFGLERYFLRLMIREIMPRPIRSEPDGSGIGRIEMLSITFRSISNCRVDVPPVVVKFMAYVLKSMGALAPLLYPVIPAPKGASTSPLAKLEFESEKPI